MKYYTDIPEVFLSQGKFDYICLLVNGRVISKWVWHFCEFDNAELPN